MKTVSMVRNSLTVLAASALVVSSRVMAEDAAAPKSAVVWQQIGTAPGVVGMAVAGSNLFAVTSDKRLLACNTATTNVEWKTVGDAPGGVVAMGAAEGKLYVSLNARAAGRLLTRDAVTENASWQDIGHAWCLVGIAGAPGKIYAVVDTKEVGAEPSIMVRNTIATPEDKSAEAGAGRGLDGLPWRGIDRRPPLGSLAITEVGGTYYVATKEDALYAGNPTKPDVAWKAIGDAAGVTILAGGNGKIFAATKSGKIMMWAPKTSK